MFEIKLEPREYQKNILETAKNNNTLVILPTGLGKTLISVMLSLYRLNKFPESKSLILAPTKPLANQHFNSFIENTTIPKEKISLVTGLISPKKRENIYKEAKIIIATPQTIQFDIENNRINLENINTLTIDECHRSRQNFANTKVAKEYIKKSQFPNILFMS